jgi:hypothetical protein
LATDSSKGVHDADGEKICEILLLVGFNGSESERFDFGHASNAGLRMLRPRRQPLATHRLPHPPGPLQTAEKLLHGLSAESPVCDHSSLQRSGL